MVGEVGARDGGGLSVDPAGGTSIETAFYGNLSRLKARGVKQGGPVTRLSMKLD